FCPLCPLPFRERWEKPIRYPCVLTGLDNCCDIACRSTRYSQQHLLRLIELHQCLQVEAVAQHLAAIQGFIPLGRIVIEKPDALLRVLGTPQTPESEASSIAGPKDEHPSLLPLYSLRPTLPLADQP